MALEIVEALGNSWTWAHAWASSFSSEFVAAVIGAVIGGFISFFIQISATRSARKEREIERSQYRAAIGNGALFKAIKITSNTLALHDHIEHSFMQNQEKDQSRPWGFVNPILTFHEEIKFTTEEMSFILSLKNNELFNRIMNLDSMYLTHVSMHSEYRRMRDELIAQLPVRRLDGGTATTFWTEELILQLGPKNHYVTVLLQHLRASVEAQYHEAYSLVQMLHKELVRQAEFRGAISFNTLAKRSQREKDRKTD